jgi:hypothetical protein
VSIQRLPALFVVGRWLMPKCLADYRRFVVHSWVKMVVPLCLLVVMTLGCGLCGQIPDLSLPGGGDEAEEVVATVIAEVDEPTIEEDSDSGTESAGDDEGPDEADLPSVTMGLNVLDSYVSDFRMTIKDSDDGPETLSYQMRVAYVRDPLAQRIEIGSDDSPERLLSVRIGDAQYFTFGDGECIVSSVGEDEAPMGEMFDPDEVVGDISSAKRVRPDETINGIRCRHYAFDETAFAGGQFTTASGDAWIAVDGDYVVRFVAEAEGNNPATGDEGYISLEYEISEVNRPIVIEPPEGCESLEETDLPVLPDAADMQRIAGTLMYTTQSAVEDVVAFYQEEMPAAGWSEEDQSFISGEVAMLSFSKDGGTATVSISADDGTTTVAIMTE